jgi:hypothetical protein
MHFFDNSPPPRKPEAPPQKEAPPQLLDGPMRLLLVLLAAAIAGYFLLPGDSGGQRQDIYGGVEPVDVFGLRPRGDGDAEARSRLRLPEAVGNARGQERRSTGRERSRPGEPDQYPPRWSDCTPGPDGRCRLGEWHDGTPRRRDGGRW